MVNLLEQRYIVAFVDALGSKERIRDKKQDVFFENLKSAVNEAKDFMKRMQDVELLNSNIQMRTFSDNLFFFLELAGDLDHREKQCREFITYLDSIQGVFAESGRFQCSVQK